MSVLIVMGWNMIGWRGNGCVVVVVNCSFIMVLLFLIVVVW